MPPERPDRPEGRPGKPWPKGDEKPREENSCGPYVRPRGFACSSSRASLHLAQVCLGACNATQRLPELGTIRLPRIGPSDARVLRFAIRTLTPQMDSLAELFAWFEVSYRRRQCIAQVAAQPYPELPQFDRDRLGHEPMVHQQAVAIDRQRYTFADVKTRRDLCGLSRFHAAILRQRRLQGQRNCRYRNRPRDRNCQHTGSAVGRKILSPRHHHQARRRHQMTPAETVASIHAPMLARIAASVPPARLHDDPAPGLEVPAFAAPRFAETSCSQCGASLGHGNSGVSHCRDHRIKAPIGPNGATVIESTIDDCPCWVEYDYSPGDPGKTSGPPEHCWPPEPEHAELLSVGIGLGPSFWLDAEVFHPRVRARWEQAAIDNERDKAESELAEAYERRPDDDY